jgi:hypothetical protein
MNYALFAACTARGMVQRGRNCLRPLQGPASFLARSCVSCCSPQVLCVSGAPDQVSDDEVLISCLNVPSPPWPMVLPRLPTVMMKFPFRVSRTVLLWCRVMVMLRFPSCARIFSLLYLPSYFSPATCPAGWLLRSMPGQALSGRVNIDLLLLNHHTTAEPKQTEATRL